MLPQANRSGTESPEIDLLTQILKVLQSSTIAEERGQDTFSRFWAAYKKVSGEYDGDMLETCNGNMDIVLIFAGLFSAVNTAFIIAMQPNPVDTANALLVQLIQISSYGPSAVQPAGLSVSTGYSNNFWPQALAYASLALSLLAAFGAVLGKQWLEAFQTLQKWQFQNVLQSFPLLLQMSLLLFGLSIGAWMQTQQKAISILILATTGFGFLFHVFTIVVSVTSTDCPFQTPISLAIQAILPYFRASEVPQSPVPRSPVPRSPVPPVLQSPVPPSPVPQSPVLQSPVSQSLVPRSPVLQSPVSQSLVLRSPVLQSPVSQSLVPRSPVLQSPVSQSPVPRSPVPQSLVPQSPVPPSPVPQSPVLQSPVSQSLVPRSPDGDSTASAMLWILKTSTNPDILSSVVELLPVVLPVLPDMNIVSLCKEVQVMFKACFDHRGLAILQDAALAYGQALIHFAWNNHDTMQTLRDSRLKWNIWESWRSLYFPWALEQCLISYNRMRETSNADSRNIHQADTRTALRMAVTTGIDEFTHPDDEKLIWNGQFRLHSSEPDRRGTDNSIYQLMQCVWHFYEVGDFDVAGDALLLASGIATTLWQKLQDQQDLLDWQNRQKRIQGIMCSSIITLLNTTPRLPTRLRCIALSAADRILGSGCLGDNLGAAILMAVCPPADIIQNPGNKDEFQPTDAIDLLNWPEGDDLELSLLPEIQRLILHVLPIPWIGDAAKYCPYLHAIIRMMGVDNLAAVRHSALHTASRDRQALTLAAAPEIDDSLRNMVLSKLSPALLVMTNDSSIPEDALTDYLRLIAALARSPDWCYRLVMDGHVERCITLIDNVHDHDPVVGLNLASFFLRIAPPGQEASCCGHITNNQWWFLLEATWRLIAAGHRYTYGDEIMNIIDIQTLARATEAYMPQDLSNDDLKSLNGHLDRALDTLRRRMSEQTDISAVTGLNDIVYSLFK